MSDLTTAACEDLPHANPYAPSGKTNLSLGGKPGATNDMRIKMAVASPFPTHAGVIHLR